MLGDVLLLYTDGITEAADSSGALFGEERLCQVVRENHTLAPQQLIEQLLEQVLLYTGETAFNDDLSLVAMRVEA